MFLGGSCSFLHCFFDSKDSRIWYCCSTFAYKILQVSQDGPALSCQNGCGKVSGTDSHSHLPVQQLTEENLQIWGITIVTTPARQAKPGIIVSRTQIFPVKPGAAALQVQVEQHTCCDKHIASDSFHQDYFTCGGCSNKHWLSKIVSKFVDSLEAQV